MANYNKPTVGFHTNPERINKAGAPKKDWTWAGLIADEANVMINGETRKKRVVKAVFVKGESGDVKAFKVLSDRTDGLPKQNMDLTSGGEPIRLILDKLEHGQKTVG